jgi:hypothetical protein
MVHHLITTGRSGRASAVPPIAYAKAAPVTFQACPFRAKPPVSSAAHPGVIRTDEPMFLGDSKDDWVAFLWYLIALSISAAIAYFLGVDVWTVFGCLGLAVIAACYFYLRYLESGLEKRNREHNESHSKTNRADNESEGRRGTDSSPYNKRIS